MKVMNFQVETRNRAIQGRRTVSGGGIQICKIA